MKKFFYLFLLSLLVLVSCSKREDEESKPSRTLNLTANGISKKYTVVASGVFTVKGVSYRVISGTMNGNTADSFQMLILENQPADANTKPYEVAFSLQGLDYYFDPTKDDFTLNLASNDSKVFEGYFGGTLKTIDGKIITINNGFFEYYY